MTKFMNRFLETYSLLFSSVLLGLYEFYIVLSKAKLSNIMIYVTIIGVILNIVLGLLSFINLGKANNSKEFINGNIQILIYSLLGAVLLVCMLILNYAFIPALR